MAGKRKELNKYCEKNVHYFPLVTRPQYKTSPLGEIMGRDDSTDSLFAYRSFKRQKVLLNV